MQRKEDMDKLFLVIVLKVSSLMLYLILVIPAVQVTLSLSLFGRVKQHLQQHCLTDVSGSSSR